MDDKRRGRIERRIAATFRLAWMADAPPHPDTSGMTVEEMAALVAQLDAESAMLSRVSEARWCRRRGNG